RFASRHTRSMTIRASARSSGSATSMATACPTLLSPTRRERTYLNKCASEQPPWRDCDLAAASLFPAEQLQSQRERDQRPDGEEENVMRDIAQRRASQHRRTQRVVELGQR